MREEVKKRKEVNGYIKAKAKARIKRQCALLSSHGRILQTPSKADEVKTHVY